MFSKYASSTRSHFHSNSYFFYECKFFASRNVMGSCRFMNFILEILLIGGKIKNHIQEQILEQMRIDFKKSNSMLCPSRYKIADSQTCEPIFPMELQKIYNKTSWLFLLLRYCFLFFFLIPLCENACCDTCYVYVFASKHLNFFTFVSCFLLLFWQKIEMKKKPLENS